MEKKSDSKQAKITKIEVTTDKISGRGGLFFFIKYVENIRFFTLFENYFRFIKGSCKGLSCFEFIKQPVVWFIDGTDTSMQSFDRRKCDESYASLLENRPDRMATSHQIKRMFHKFSFIRQMVFRSVLPDMFTWRLLRLK
ncbi:MAG: hypothetical protein EHM72_11740 [Calditrichaeota bacterium]|nr:MAG: hypothetical protein EHM72_11740 [Calditrichota bacterium]